MFRNITTSARPQGTLGMKRRPASFTGKRTDHLFPLEEECEQGKALLAKAPKTLLHLQEFDPYGLQQTYRDEASGAELPVSAVFDLEGSHQLTFEITTDWRPTTNQPKSFPERVPFQKTQASVTKINYRRMKSERMLTRLLCNSGNLLCFRLSLGPPHRNSRGRGTLCPCGGMVPWRILRIHPKPVRT